MFRLGEVSFGRFARRSSELEYRVADVPAAGPGEVEQASYKALVHLDAVVVEQSFFWLIKGQFSSSVGCAHRVAVLHAETLQDRQCVVCLADAELLVHAIARDFHP